MEPNPVVTMLSTMIEEAQAAANEALTEPQRLAHLAQRDALTEAKLRIRDRRSNPEWMRFSGATYQRFSGV